MNSKKTAHSHHTTRANTNATKNDVPHNTPAKPAFVQPFANRITNPNIRKIGHKMNASLPRYRKAG